MLESKGHLLDVFLNQAHLCWIVNHLEIFVYSKLSICIGTKGENCTNFCHKSWKVITTLYLGNNIIRSILWENSLRWKDVFILTGILATLSFEVRPPWEYLSVVSQDKVVSWSSSYLFDRHIHVLSLLNEQRSSGELELPVIETKLSKLIWANRKKVPTLRQEKGVSSTTAYVFN